MGVSSDGMLYFGFQQVGGDDDRPDYLHKLRDFGREYLTNCFTQEQAVAEASRNLEWDSDAQSMVDWIKARAGAVGGPGND